MVRQKIIEPLCDGALVRSRKGKTYKAIFKSKVMQIPADATYAEVEFDHETPVITRFWYPTKEPETTVEEQEEAFRQLGGDY